MNRVCAATISLLFLCVTAKAYDPLKDLMAEVGDKPKDESTSEFLSECSSIQPGQTFSVALALSHPDEWHSYYKNTGGIELNPSITLKLPEGFTAGEIQWPVPHLNDPGFQFDEKNPVKSYQYSAQEAFLIIDIKAPSDAKVGTSITIQVDASWQICKKGNCKDEKASFSLTLPVADKAQINAQASEDFREARSRQGSKSAMQFSFESEGNKLQLVINGAKDISNLYYIADHPMIMAIAQQQSWKEEDQWRIDLKTQKENAAGIEIEPTKALGGFLQYTEGGEKKVAMISPTAITAATQKLKKPAAEPLSLGVFMGVLTGMFLGGLLLNLMPCVFPVIGIKILGFVQQSGQDRKKIVLHGVVFALGVMVSFWVLSGILFAVRGEGIGWGYQLQNQWVVLALMMMMFVMALNLFGIFEMGTSATSIGGNLQSKQGMTGTFFSGVLATVVATPCSGPFLGTAIGAAIGLPATQFFIAFTVMAVGLSLPYLILSAFPELVDYLPRPGPWMETFKQGMSFLLFATAGYLLWVYGGIIDFDNLLNPIIGLTLVALGLWIYGRWSGFMFTKRTRVIATIVAMIAVIGGIYYSGNIRKGLDWQPWSEVAVEQSLAEGKPVYVDFTAKWCLTCQLNKKVAYTAEVIELFNQYGIVPMKADKTKPSPHIEKALKELKRTAIPVNVLYIPGKDPIITPETLTAGYMKELIEKNVPTKDAK